MHCSHKTYYKFPSQHAKNPRSNSKGQLFLSRGKKMRIIRILMTTGVSSRTRSYFRQRIATRGRESDSRENGHHVARHCPEQINRQALVQTSPALLLDNLACDINDTATIVRLGHPIRRHVLGNGWSKCLQSGSYYFMRVCSNSGGDF